MMLQQRHYLRVLSDQLPQLVQRLRRREETARHDHSRVRVDSEEAQLDQPTESGNVYRLSGRFRTTSGKWIMAPGGIGELLI